MSPESLHTAFKQRRTELGLSQREVAKRGGIEQRQVSAFERGGDVTVTTLLKLASALEMALFPVPREAVPRVRAAVIQTKEGPTSPPAQSLLDLYGVPDNEEEKRA